MAEIQAGVRLPEGLVKRVVAVQDGKLVNSKRAAFITVLEAGLKALAKEKL